MKTSTIPRLELQAALIASRLATVIVEEHDIKPHRIVLWSDSRTVLSWIRSENRRFRQYAAQRVGEILEHTNSNDWRWVPSKDNVADDATHINNNIWDKSERWYTGPAFLQKNELEWPQEIKTDASDVDLEVIENCYNTNVSIDLFKLEYHSSLVRVVRVIGWVLRFLYNSGRKLD